MFMHATTAVSAPALRKTDKIQLFPGDMYRSCPEACALLVSKNFPAADTSYDQYACIPVEVHLFVLGPLMCDKQLMVVLLTTKQPGCSCKSHFALYSPCAGTIRLRSGVEFALSGTTAKWSFRAGLPLDKMTGCGALSSVRAEMTLLDACDAAGRDWFDRVLAVYLTECASGFVHIVDWMCLKRRKYLVASGTGALKTATDKYQALLEQCTDSSAHLLCPDCPASCADACSACTSTSSDLASCSCSTDLLCTD